MTVVHTTKYTCDVCGNAAEEKNCACFTIHRIGEWSFLSSTFTLERYSVPLDFSTVFEKCICVDCIREIRKYVDILRNQNLPQDPILEELDRVLNGHAHKMKEERE